jgi:hypothetical protein
MVDCFGISDVRNLVIEDVEVNQLLESLQTALSVDSCELWVQRMVPL